MFYSRAAGFMTTVVQPQMAILNGVAQVTGGKIVEFTPLGDGWGYYSTDDPEIIAALEQNRNVVSPEVYQDMTTSNEVKLRMERDEKRRLVEQNNQLLKELEDIRAKAKSAGK